MRRGRSRPGESRARVPILGLWWVRLKRRKIQPFLPWVKDLVLERVLRTPVVLVLIEEPISFVRSVFGLVASMCVREEPGVINYLVGDHFARRVSFSRITG